MRTLTYIMFSVLMISSFVSAQGLSPLPGYPKEMTYDEYNKLLKVAGIPTVVLKGIVTKILLQEFEKVADRLLDQGKQTGNALISHLGDEIKVATRNLDYIIGRQRDQTFDRLDPALRNIFFELNKAIETFNPDKIHQIGELFILDLVDHLPKYLVDKRDFYIERIEGLTVYHRTDDFILKITGIGFGFDNADRHYKKSFRIDKQELSSDVFFQQHGKELQINIPNKLVEPHFSQNKTIQLPVQFRTRISKRRGWWQFWKSRWAEADYPIDFSLILLPKDAGEITVTEVLTNEVLGNVEEKAQTSWTPPGGCKKACFWEDRKKVAENQRITRVVLDHNNVAHCDWSYNTRGGRDPDFEILDGGREVVVRRKYDHKDQGCTITYNIFYKTYTKVYQTKQHNLKIKYGEPIQVNLDAQNANGNFEIAGNLITKQKIYISNVTINNPQGPIRFLGNEKVGGGFRAEFKLSTE